MSTGDLSKLRVVELKEELRKRGASVSGVKDDLILRLEELVAQESAPSNDVDVETKTETKTVTPTKTVTKAETKVETPTETSHGFEYEFGGPIGALGVMVGLPGVIYMLFFVCGGINDWCLASPSQYELLFEHLGKLPSVSEWFTYRATSIFLAWFMFQVALERLLPGELVEGVKLSTGERLKYRLNGHLAFWVSLLVVAHGWPLMRNDSNTMYGFTSFPLSILYDEYLGLASASIAFSVLLSFYLYLTSFTGNKLIAEGGKSGNMLYDFFIGRELNPRIGSLDLKYFCELRPGLIGWVVLNLGMAAKQFELHGEVSASMILINLFQGIYVWDALFQERCILTTMDITTDGFGFMLVFGDLAWVPFTYTLQARYLVSHDPNLSLPVLIAIVALNIFGFSVFRGANSQKDEFRRDPNSKSVSHLKFMQTARGTKLLVSGWWGMARKINYTGDWCMGLSWCLLTGTNSFIPFFYAIYFGVLLVHRAIRDDGFCREKYGDDWTEYKKKVPAMFIPGFPF